MEHHVRISHVPCIPLLGLIDSLTEYFTLDDQLMIAAIGFGPERTSQNDFFSPWIEKFCHYQPQDKNSYN
jgi:hypothetical protein